MKSEGRTQDDVGGMLHLRYPGYGWKYSKVIGRNLDFIFHRSAFIFN